MSLIFENETNLCQYYRKPLKLKSYFQNSFKSCKISTFSACFLGSVILYKLNTGTSSDQHNFE